MQNFARPVLKAGKLDKDIAKTLPMGLKSGKYEQEYRDFGAFQSPEIAQT